LRPVFYFRPPRELKALALRSVTGLITATAHAIGPAIIKWFGLPAIGQTTTGHGCTAIMSAANTAGIGTATVMSDTMIAVITATIVATIGTTTGINQLPT
jgi:hypothetical protein